MTAQTEPIRALAARYYTDPALFAAERESLLARTWQFAGHVSQLEKPGDYFAFEIAGQSLFCLRDGQGEIRAYYNVCQHRAHELLQGSGNRKLIVCPYHAWTYELTGELRAGPNIRAVPGLERSEICLTSVRVEDFCGFLFINLDPDAAPMEIWFPKVREELSAFVPDIARIKPLHWIEVTEACNWKVAIENYSECYHCARNHRSLTSGVIKLQTYDIQPQGHCLRHTTQCQNLDKMSYPIDPDANAHAGNYSSWFLWPLFSFQVFPGNRLNSYHWRPLAVDQVAVWRGWYSLDGAEDKVVRDLAALDKATTMAEDISLVESVQRGLRSRGYRPGPLVIDPQGGVNSEHSLQALHNWMRESIDDLA